MADARGPEVEEDVEYIEVFEEVTDEEDDAGEFVEQQQGETSPAAAPAVETSQPAAPEIIPAAVPLPPQSIEAAAAAAAAAGSPPPGHGSSTSTAGEGSIPDVALPAPSHPLATESATADTAAAANAGSLGSQGDLVHMEQQASKVAADVAQLASQVTHKLHDGLLQAFSGAAAMAIAGDDGRSSGRSPGLSTTAALQPQPQLPLLA
ncbi:hypothetical protein COO60DRAFT_618190 [Scenedesmus sp. NREL 46B-D3]|nr:hypothetical protein COO60DRAFT_618190 [Scenedesmus sp. NREL 46B-D3]